VETINDFGDVMGLRQPFVAFGLFFSFVLLGADLSPDATGQSVPAFNFDTSFDDAIAQAALDQGIRLDPQVAVDIKGDAGVFFGNFCSESSISDPASECRTGLGGHDSLAELVGQYLKDSISHSPQIETLASRLARRAGNEIERTGWPGSRGKATGFVRVPASLQDATISLQTATGLRRLRGNGSTIVLNAGSRSLIAVDDSANSSKVQVDVRPGAEAAWVDGGRTSLGRIGVSVANYCNGSPTPATAKALETFNWSRSSLSESDNERAAHIIPVAKQAALDIQVVDETGNCNADCHLGLGIAFAQAIAVWRSGCERCGRQALSSIRVGTHVWLDRTALDRLIAFDPDGDTSEFLALSKPAISDVVPATAPSLTVPVSGIIGYEYVESDSKLGSKLCGLSSQEAWVVGAQGLLCTEAGSQVGDELHPTLVVRPQPTDCGGEAIACGIPGGLVQITTSRYSFNVDGPAGAVLLGDSNRQLNVAPIILHEVGHWFGVPHPEQVDVEVEDVMAGVFDSGNTCVSAASLTMLNNASDDRWEFRAETHQALLPPPDAP